MLAKEVGISGAGRASVVKELLRKGADPNYIDGETRMPVIAVAAENGHAACLRVLAEEGADVNCTISRVAGVPLHKAVLCADPAKARACVDALLSV